MSKTYISALLVMMMVLAQSVYAQDSMDDVFAQLDAGNSGDNVVAPEVATPASAEMTPSIEGDDQAPELPASVRLAQFMEAGLALYKAEKYDEAIRAFDAMLEIDEFNKDAMKYRKRASMRIAARESRKLDATRAKRMAEIDSAWIPDAKVLGSVVDNEDGPVDPDQEATDQMVARLKAINIPSLDFDNTSIEDVVLFLTEQSRTLDRAGNGVNIILIGMDAAEGERAVTTVITDINLFNALQVISEMASLKFEVKPGAVAIMPANYSPVSKMVMRSYDVIPEVGGELEKSDQGNGGDDLFGEASTQAASGPVDVAGFFSIVEFPEGASATYRPRFHKLFVKNTPENLDAIENVLDDLEDRAIKRRAQQVEIEAKFVEFGEGALEELGFDWTVYGSGSVGGFGLKPGSYYQKQAGYTDVAGIEAGTVQVFRDPVTGQGLNRRGSVTSTGYLGRPGQNLFGASQRINGDVGGGGVGGAFQVVRNGILTKMGGSPAAMLFSNGDVDLRISAMEQQGTADVLSAPKVTTKSGAVAIIRVAETHRYPRDFDVETGQRTVPVVKPQDWEDVDLGVALRVTPMVSETGETIDLELRPEIMSFKGYDDYIMGYISTKPNKADQHVTYDPGNTTLFARMAYFDRRVVETEVTIADGHTVVMGGLVDERTETFRDQIPFLGDIPYIGRLFRTEGSRSAKINLTVFVRATQVDENGLSAAERELARQ